MEGATSAAATPSGSKNGFLSEADYRRSLNHLHYTYGWSGQDAIAGSTVLVTRVPALDDLVRCLVISGVPRIFVESSQDISELRTHFESQADVQTAPEGWRDDPKFKEKLSCIISGAPTLEEAVKLNALARSSTCSFLWLAANGGLISLFCDPGVEEPVINPHGYCGSDFQEVEIALVQPGSPVLVTCSSSHGLGTGDIISIAAQPAAAASAAITDRGGGCDATDNSCAITVVSENQFHIPEDSGLTIKEGGVVKLRRRNTGKQTYSIVESSAWQRPCDETRQQHAAFLCRSLGITDQSAIAQLLSKLNIPQETASQVSVLLNRPDPPPHFTRHALGVLFGFVCSEAIKCITQRFAPLHQWMHCDLWLTRTGDHSSQRLLLHGFGPLGVRVFQTFLTTDSVDKVILVGDEVVTRSAIVNCPDVFRSVDLQQPVVRRLKALAHELRRDLEVVALPLELSPEMEREHFDAKFFEEVDLILSTGGSWETRRYLGNLSVQYSKKLIDIGADKLQGHLQTVIPFLTESHGCSQDPSDVDYPFCVLKSFPFTAEHAIWWAAEKTKNLLQLKPMHFNSFWVQNPSKDICSRMKNGEVPEHSRLVFKLLLSLGNSEEVTWDGCIRFARLKFEKYFSHKALHLLSAFPADSLVSSGARFWTFPKREPRPVEFDPVGDPVHLACIYELAHLWADLWSVPEGTRKDGREEILEILNTVRVPEFQKRNKTVVTDEKISKEEVQDETENGDIDVEKFEHLIKHSKVKTLRTDNLEMTKLDRLILCFSFLRCQMYGIPCPEPCHVKAVCDRLCPCPEPIVQTMAHLACLELNRPATPLNWWLSLEPPALLASDSVRCRSDRLSDSLTVTLWDKLEIQGEPDWTLQDFLNHLKRKFGVEATMVVQGSKMVFVHFMPLHAKRKTNLMSKLISPEPNEQFALLSITVKAEDDDEEDRTAPPIKYFL